MGYRAGRVRSAVVQSAHPCDRRHKESPETRLHGTGAGQQMGYRHYGSQNSARQIVSVRGSGSVQQIGYRLVDASPAGPANGDASSRYGGLAETRERSINLAFRS